MLPKLPAIALVASMAAVGLAAPASHLNNLSARENSPGRLLKPPALGIVDRGCITDAPAGQGVNGVTGKVPAEPSWRRCFDVPSGRHWHLRSWAPHVLGKSNSLGEDRAVQSSQRHPHEAGSGSS
ncbi:MAG: hypothetical protein Q9174_001810 [Haloplaca sp. 1 TL-2023]